MSSVNSIHIFTHLDLDGAGSLMALTWAFPDVNITYTPIGSTYTFAKDFSKWCQTKKITDFTKIFIVDLSLRQDVLHLIDYKNVIYIDHHKTSSTLQFTNAHTFISEHSSCTLQIYSLFKKSIDINDKQKKLIALIDDYDSYKLIFNKSKHLNILFWNFYNTSLSTFLTDFYDGFVDFTEVQQKIIHQAVVNQKNIINNLKLFSCKTKINNKEAVFVSTFADSCINEVAEYILLNSNIDVAVVVNIKNERVSFRRNKNSNIDVSILAQKMCNGGGHEAAAGGQLTEDFLTFSKSFTPLN